jgi:hypothetical protein
MKRVSLFLITSAVLALPVSVWANTSILNENFDELPVAGNTTSAGAFSAISGNVDVVGPGFFANLCAAPESDVCIDLDGSVQGAIQTNASFTLNPGTNYYLSFDLIGSQRGGPAATLIDFGPYSQLFVLGSGDDVSGIVTNALVTVSTTTVTHLTFLSETPGDEGNLLDDVTITSAATPEPSFMMLLLPGVMGLLVLARRRQTR